ncbi:MAG: class B sortase [Lachnospiraceae bacterium]|nr:class B sortase [Lachnospiraceae bacterium]MDD7626711.1 class B sortase [Lachnospiraceae bacterium]MDY4117925.1 class B sortase [Lachnospiraceae bacterium]
MTAGELTVAGRRFRTRADYEAALRDQKKIERIKAETDLDNPKQIYELLKDLQSGSYRFETIVGRDFDDEIYEKAEALKKQGITPENAAKTVKADKKKKEKASRLIEKKSKKKESSVNLSDYDKDMQKQILIELRKQEKRRKLIVVLSSLVAVLCFGYFGVYYFFAARTSMDYEQLSDLKGSDALSETQEKNDFSLHKSSVKLPDILDEYKTLYSKNKRLIGWLKIDDTNIDYPVMQTENNEYYLDHNFNQEYDKNGSLFLDCDCNVYPRSTNMIIYGHHMKSGSMFGNLQQYAKESYGKKHSVIEFDTIYEKATYQVMYVFRSQVYNEDDVVFKYYQFIEANSEEEFNFYMKEMASMSLYDTGVTANFGDSLLTLSTCDSSQTDGRFVVVAKRIK